MKGVFASALLVGGAVSLSLSPTEPADKPYTPGQPVQRSFDAFAQGFLDNYCIDCHDDGLHKGGLSLEGLGPVDETNADVWKSVWAQVTLGQMPPRDRKSQPGVVERLTFSDWVVGQLQATMKDKGGFHDHQDPN